MENIDVTFDFFGIINDTGSIKTRLDFTSAKGWEIFEILQDIERHEGVMKKSTKAWSVKMRLALLAPGGTGVDHRAGECEAEAVDTCGWYSGGFYQRYRLKKIPG